MDRKSYGSSPVNRKGRTMRKTVREKGRTPRPLLAAPSLVMLFLITLSTGCTISGSAGDARRSAVREARARANKDLVVEFYQRVLIDGEYGAAPEYLREDYIQHNPRVPPGLEGFMSYFEATGKRLEQMQATLSGEIEHAIAEGNKVVIFVSYHIEGPIGLDFKAADLFRVQDGLIAEHWDVMQGATLRDHALLLQE